MEVLKFCTICVDGIWRARDMGDTLAEILVWVMAVFKQPGSHCKFW